MELVADKYKQTEMGLIPSDWEVRELGYLLKFGSGKDYKDLRNGEIPVYGTGGIMTYVNDFLYNGDSVGIGRKGTIDKPVFLSGRFWTVDTLFYTHDFRNVIPKFLFYKFLLIKWKEYNEASGVPSLNKNTLEKIKISVPTLEEQTAIATALSDADALISSLEKLIAKKRMIKQGAMQQLLQPKEGWEVKKLGEIVEKITTGKLDANAANENGAYRFYTCAKNYFFINEYAFDDEALLVSGNGENVGYVHYYKGRFNAYQRTYVITGFNQNIHFVKIYLDRYLPERIDSEVNSGNTPYIKMGTLTDMRISLPDMREQTRIATILSDMDAEIAALEAKLEKYRKVKLGMMQNLLTGKIRLV